MMKKWAVFIQKILNKKSNKEKNDILAERAKNRKIKISQQREIIKAQHREILVLRKKLLFTRRNAKKYYQQIEVMRKASKGAENLGLRVGDVEKIDNK